MKIYPQEDGGLIGPIKSKTCLENGKSGRTGCKGMVENCSLTNNFFTLITILCKFERIFKN
jgi:hypothetical protein